jgi:hypothetical protein
MHKSHEKDECAETWNVNDAGHDQTLIQLLLTTIFSSFCVIF